MNAIFFILEVIALILDLYGTFYYIHRIACIHLRNRFFQKLAETLYMHMHLYKYIYVFQVHTSLEFNLLCRTNFHAFDNFFRSLLTFSYFSLFVKNSYTFKTLQFSFLLYFFFSYQFNLQLLTSMKFSSSTITYFSQDIYYSCIKT